MPATPALKTDTSSGRVGRVTIANAYNISGPLGVTPAAQIAIEGSDDAFNEGSPTVEASLFPGRVVAIGPLPTDLTGSVTASDTWIARMTGVSRALTMPPSPWDGMRVGVVDADGTAIAGDVITVFANTGQSIEDPYNSNTHVAGPGGVTFYIPHQRIDWEWDQTASLWRVVLDTKQAELPAAVIANTNLALTGKRLVKASTASAILTVTLPVSPTEGMVVAVKDVGGNSGLNNITIAAGGGGWTVQPVNSTGAAPASTCVISNNHAGAEWRADTVNKVWWAVCIL